MQPLDFVHLSLVFESLDELHAPRNNTNISSYTGKVFFYEEGDLARLDRSYFELTREGRTPRTNVFILLKCDSGSVRISWKKFNQDGYMDIAEVSNGENYFVEMDWNESIERISLAQGTATPLKGRYSIFGLLS